MRAGLRSGLQNAISRNTNQQWYAFPLLTIGDEVAGYTPPGRLDGLGAFQLGGNKVQILANHEIAGNDGYTYKLKNGTELNGARISFFDVRSDNFQITNAGIAYDEIVDRQGDEVSAAAQINEGNNGKRGLSKLCSARSIQAGDFGFVDDIYFAGEEAKQGLSYLHGGRPRTINVELDLAKMKSFGVSLSQITDILEATNVRSSSGTLVNNNTVKQVRAGGMLNNADDLSKLVVALFKHKPVYLGDIAEITDGPAEITEQHRFAAGAAFSGKRPLNYEVPAVSIAIAKRSGSNAVTVAEDVLEKLDEIRTQLIPEDVNVNITATKYESTIPAATVMAKELKNIPTIPSINATGINTASNTDEIARIENATSLIPSNEA